MRIQQNVASCIVVLILARNVTVVAASFPFLAFKSRKAPTQNSLANIILPRNAMNMLSRANTRPIKTNVIKILSAIGSRTAPNTEVREYFLAKYPSQ